MSDRQAYKWVIYRAYFSVAALAMMALYAAKANADDAESKIFSFSGYGTFGLVHSTENRADFTGSFLKPTGSGYSQSWSYGPDSKIAAQATATITPKLSAVLQVISEQGYDKKYIPSIEWANVKYEVTPELSLRVGRTALATFMVSDYRKVGYSIPWLRSPSEVYGLYPISNSDGIDANYQLHLGELTYTLQGSYGKKIQKVPGGSTAYGDDLWSLVTSAEYSAWTVRAAYVKTRLDLDAYTPLFDAFRQFGPDGVAVAEKYDIYNKQYKFMGLGASYEPGDWFLMGEWGRTFTHSVLGNSTGWYVSSGYRFGKLTPYVTFAEVKVKGNHPDPGINLANLAFFPPQVIGAAAALNGTLNGLLAGLPAQKSIAIGARWDVMKNVALKAQYDHIDIGKQSSGLLLNAQSDLRRGGRDNLFSVAVDFVF